MKNYVVLFAMAMALGLAGSASAALLMNEGFEGGLNGWDVSTGTQPAILYTGGTWASTGSNALQLQTGSYYEIGETPTFNLTGATTATIEFDYMWDVIANNGTRYFTVDFWDGASWTTGPRYNAIVTPTPVHISYSVSSGFGPNNKFRIEGKNAGGGGVASAYIDNVTIDADVIPEPGSISLLAVSVLGAAIVRRRLK